MSIVVKHDSAVGGKGVLVTEDTAQALGWVVTLLDGATGDVSVEVRQVDIEDPVHLLLPVDWDALRLTAELWHHLNLVVGDGATRDADLAELVGPIHVIQRYVMSQAAARAYPTECRLLGGSLATTRAEEGSGA